MALLVPAAAALLALVTMTAPAAATSASVDQAEVCLECHDDVASEIQKDIVAPRALGLRESLREAVRPSGPQAYVGSLFSTRDVS